MHVLFLLAAICFFFAAAGSLFFLTWRDRSRQMVAERLQEMSRTKIVTAVDTPTVDAPVDRSHRLLPPVMRARVEAALAATGHAISFRTLALIAVMAGVVAWMVSTLVLGLHLPLAAVATLVIMGLVPWQLVRFLQAQQTAAFLKLFPDAIDLIVRAVRAGLPVLGAMDAAGRETPNPVGNEFRQIIADIQIGVDFAEALRRAGRRVHQVEFDFLVATLILQRESGGNLSETLATLSAVLRRRSELRAKTKAMTSEARTSALVIGSLPFFAAGALAVISPQYIGVLLADPRGGYLLGGGFASMTMGGLVMRGLIRSAMR